MKLLEITEITPSLAEQIIVVWEKSVKATHLFLSENEVEEIKKYIPQALNGIAHLIIAKDKNKRIVAFMGIEEQKLEMLFVAPEERGKGLGRALIRYGIENYSVNELAVNEQNPLAKGFYEHMGFHVYKRTDHDEQGNPYPLLYMKLKNHADDRSDSMTCMNTPQLETERLILRKFTENDVEALYLILKDKEVNTFLPWFPLKNIAEARAFFETRYAATYEKPQSYAYAICLKEDNYPIGYIKVDMDESHDFGYGLRKEFWHRGIVTEAGKAVVAQVKKDGLPYITSTHDINNPRSGGVMKQVGMKYQYSYEEQWQPKNFLVTFRMYQLNFDEKGSGVFKKYWDNSTVHFVETEI